MLKFFNGIIICANGDLSLKNNNMETKTQDYLHLYLGCEVMVESVAPFNDNNAGNSRIKGPFTLVAVGIMEQRVHVKLDGYTVTASDIIKPILRPLSDITEEEATECGWMELFTIEHFAEKKLYRPTSFHYLLKRGFDLLDLIETGLAIDKTKGRV